MTPHTLHRQVVFLVSLLFAIWFFFVPQTVKVLASTVVTYVVANDFPFSPGPMCGTMFMNMDVHTLNSLHSPCSITR